MIKDIPDPTRTIEVCYRTPYSIWRKMQTTGCDFKHVNGKYYYRIIYLSRSDEEQLTVLNCNHMPLFLPKDKEGALQVYGEITSIYKERPGSVANYIDNPKENGYQSFHVKLLSDQGVWEEVHISSERMVRASRLGCAAERTEENVSQWLEKFKSVLQDVAFHSKDMDYMDGVTASFYNDDIMVFTPKGKGIILPKGATALDFAYEIHSKIGRHAVYARINGKLMSVKTVLHRGDCVEIGTDENSCPDTDWIDHVLTYKAKRHLRSYLSSVNELSISVALIVIRCRMMRLSASRLRMAQLLCISATARRLSVWLRSKAIQFLPSSSRRMSISSILSAYKFVALTAIIC